MGEARTTFTAGIGARPLVGRPIPRFTVHLLGKLSVGPEGLDWRPLAPWRRPRQIEVPWEPVSQVDLEASTARVRAEGWRYLTFGVSNWRQFPAALEVAGLSIHRSGDWRRLVAATRPGREPVWDRWSEGTSS